MPGQKFGRIQPAIRPHLHARMLQFGNFLTALKPPPAKCDWSKGITQWSMSLNNQLGCCLVADFDHQLTAWSANTSHGASPIVVPDSITLPVYSAISGYVPGNPATDTGCVMSDGWSYFQNKGIYGNKIIGSAAVDPANMTNVKWGTYLLGGSSIGVNLPQSALDQNDAGKIWDIAGNSRIVGGHAVYIVAYDDVDKTFTCVTWGGLQKLTYNWFIKYTDEVWVAADELWIDNVSGLAPSNLRIASLINNMAKLAA